MAIITLGVAVIASVQVYNLLTQPTPEEVLQRMQNAIQSPEPIPPMRQTCIDETGEIPCEEVQIPLTRSF